MKKAAIALSAVLLLSLSGCKKPGDVPLVGKAINSLSGMHDETEARLNTAAHQAILAGKTGEALALHARLYDRDKTDVNALNYAQLLRKSGNAEKAVEVLSRHVNGRDGTIKGAATPIMINEYAAASIETGDYATAEAALNLVLENRDMAAFHADAYNLLGIVLDAQEKHREAESAYRQALDSWKGDPASVMNNLGLSLAAQGCFDEALTVLRQALLKAPAKKEIARNIKFVSDLMRAAVPTAPVPVTRGN
jgi:Flp pilus assembly protein TadD